VSLLYYVITRFHPKEIKNLILTKTNPLKMNIATFWSHSNDFFDMLRLWKHRLSASKSSSLKTFSVFLLANLFLSWSALGQTQIITATGAGTFTVPAGVTQIKVVVRGAGGGGGANLYLLSSGGGGGGGGVATITNYSVTPGQVINYNVGSGGIGGTSSVTVATAGGAGGDTWFGSTTTLYANGGGGGGVPVPNATSTTDYIGGAGGNAGIAGGTPAAFTGGNGGAGKSGTNSLGVGGGGGSSAGNSIIGNSGVTPGGTATAAAGGTAPFGGFTGGAGGSGNTTAQATGDGKTGGLPGGGGGGGGDAGNGFFHVGGTGGRGQIEITLPCPTYALISVSTAYTPCTLSAILTLDATAAGSPLPIGSYTVTYSVGLNTGLTATMNVTTAGTGTINITGLNAGSQTITVTDIAYLDCVNTITTNNTATINVTFATPPGTITPTGGATKCANTPNQVYSIAAVPDAASYTWTMPATPAGWTITSGQGTTSITVTTGGAGTGNYMTVKSISACGTSTASSLTVSALAAPTAPIVGAITQPTCAIPTGSVALSGLPTGTWIVTANPGGLTKTAATPTTTFTGLPAGATYTFTATRSYTGCTAGPSSGNAVISAQPAAPTESILSLSGTATICSGNSTSLSVAITGGTSPFTVVYFNGTSNITVPNYTSGSNILVSPTTPTTTYSLVSVTSAVGCLGTGNIGTAIVTVNPLPSTPTITAGGATTLCNGGIVTLTSSAISDNQWYKNGVAISGETGTTYSATTSGTYTVKYISTVNGCTSLASAGTVVTVNVAPTATSGATITTCQSANPSVITLTGASIGGGATTGAWSIVSGSGTLSSTAQTANPASVTYTPAANFSGTVTLRLTSNFTSPCMAATSDRTITVNPAPTATSGVTLTTCQSVSPSAITLTGASVGGGATTGAWSIVSGSGTLSSTAQTANPASVTYTPTANFSGTVTLRLTSNFTNPCTAATSNRTITVNPAPTAGTLGGTMAICLSNTTNAFSSTVIGGAWTSGSPTVATINGTTGVITPISTGSSIMTYTVTGVGGCSDATDTRIITINALPPTPTITAGGATTFCEGSNVELTSSVSTGYQWYLDGTEIPEETAQTYIASATGVITVVTTDGVCQSLPSDPITITVLAPTITFADPVFICTGTTTTLTSTSIPATGNQWYIFDINTGNHDLITGATGTTYTVSTEGVYFAATMTPEGCFNEVTLFQVTNLTPATPTITANGEPTVFCEGTSVFLYSDIIDGNQWYKNGVAIDGEVLDYYNATASGIYTVVATDPTGMCTSEISNAINVTVNPLTEITLHPVAATYCMGETATALSVEVNGATPITYEWFSNDGSGNIIGTNATFTPPTTTEGTIQYFVTVTGVCGAVQSLIVDITINPLPTVSITSHPSVCSGSDAVFTLTGTADATVTYTLNGGVTSTVLLEGAGEGTITITGATTNQLLNLVSVQDGITSCVNTLISAPSTVMITPKPSDVVTNVTICSGVTYTWSVNSTAYTTSQTVTVTNDGCTANQILNLTVTPKPSDVVTNVTICSGSTYTWSVNSTAYTTSQTVTVTNDGCTANQILNLTVTPKPADVVTNVTICSGVTYTWSVNSVAYTTSQTVTVTNDGCTANQILNLTVTPKPADVVTNATICSGVTYTWSVNSVAYTTSQTVTITNDGCTANQILNLTVTPKPSDVVTNVTICSGVTYTWSVNSVAYTTSQTVTVTNDGCTANQILNLTVTTPPNAGVISGTQGICIAGTTTFVSSGDVGGAWTSSDDLIATVSNVGLVSGIAAGTATIAYTVTGTGGCTNAIATRIVTVNPTATATISSPTTVCSGTTAIITFTGTSNTVVTYKIDGGSNLTLPIGGTGSATITTSLTTATTISTTYTLVSIEYASTPLCTQTLTGSATITFNDCSPKLAVIVKLQGSLSGSNMSTGISTILPNTQGGKTISPTMAPAVRSTIVDWVEVALYTSISPGSNTLVAGSRRFALLTSNGNVVDMDGISDVAMTGIANGTYHVAIFHRFHLPTRTLNPINFTQGTTNTPSLVVSGNFLPNSLTSGGAMIVGDLNQDNFITTTDYILVRNQVPAISITYGVSYDVNFSSTLTTTDYILVRNNTPKLGVNLAQ
jgi:PKD-like domain/Ig-like domain CHU_C associated